MKRNFETEELFPAETVRVPMQRVSSETYVDVVLEAIARKTQAELAAEAVCSLDRRRSLDEEHARIAIDAAGYRVVHELTELYVEGVEEFGMPPIRSMSEPYMLMDEYERSRRVIELTFITEHNLRVFRRGIGEVISLDTTLPPTE